jgi:ATP-binding cassette subfamily F protein uup
MSTLLSARNLTKSYPASVLFEGLSLHLETRDRIGLIGPNGAGKSTLLKILAELEVADSGEITRRRGLKMAYIEQEDRFGDNATPLSSICEAIEESDDDRIDVETRACIALSKLGFESFEQPIDTLSGGWRKRLAIARALCHEPDVLLLDEPTNHLDLEGVLWLEGFAQRASMALIFITHDRTFLERAASRIIELSPAYPGGLFEVTGNYTEFVKRKAAFLDAQQAAESALANTVRRDTAWLRQGIQGRQTRNKTQVVAAAERRAQLKSTQNRNAAPRKTTTIDFQATDRKTRKLLGLHSVSKTMGDVPLFQSLDLQLTPGQRVGLLGPNGSGKTTLLRLLSGDLEPDSGTIKRAADLRVATFNQHRDQLDPGQTLHEALCPVGDMVNFRDKQVHVSGWAARFLFDPDQLSTQVRHLSGGEQARVLIANLMLEPADVLLLDEPTNDLDIPSLEVLEEALLQFPGALVLVTHDRFMLERIATEFVGLDGVGGVKAFLDYQQWVNHRKAAIKDSEPVRTKPTKKPGAAAPKMTRKKRTYREEREFQGMEAAILEAESQVKLLEASAADPALALDHARASRIYDELAEVQAKVKTLYARWVELDVG